MLYEATKIERDSVHADGYESHHPKQDNERKFFTEAPETNFAFSERILSVLLLRKVIIKHLNLGPSLAGYSVL
jgi:hypothetical protein